MEIKGDEFIKKVQIQQEKEELEQKLNELEEVESTINSASSTPNQNEVDLNDQELGNIMLETNSSNEDNKKKYLVLGVVLIVLFLLTIIIIRLLTDGSKEDEFTSTKTDPLETKKIEEDNIEENFQKIMNDRVKKLNTAKQEEEKKTSEELMNQIETTPKKEEISSDELDETIKKIEEKKKATPKPVAKKPEPKPVVKKEPKKVEKKPVVKKEPTKSVKELVSSISTSAPKGYFVQIGAFSKKPSQKYINNIRNANLKYKIYQVEVKGRLYNKVLIGPYSSRAVAKENIDSIKSKLNLSSAYILKF